MAADKTYILDICDEVLGKRSLRQHRFLFLKGDGGHTLPVDAYYPDLHLTIEYHELQHTTAVAIMDKKPTISGITRGEQRKPYDDCRRKVLPENGIDLVVLDCRMFALKSSRRLRRDSVEDEAVIRDCLRKFVER